MEITSFALSSCGAAWGGGGAGGGTCAGCALHAASAAAQAQKTAVRRVMERTSPVAGRATIADGAPCDKTYRLLVEDQRLQDRRFPRDRRVVRERAVGL